MNGVDGNIVRRLERWAVIAGLAALCLAVIGWLGWLLDMDRLRTVLPDLATMKANTSLGLFLCAMGLLLKMMGGERGWVSRAGMGLGALGAAVGLATLTEYLLNIDLGIDQMLGADLAPTNPHSSMIPGRMSVATATCISCLGIAVMMLDLSIRFSQGFALLALTIAGMGLLGYIYGIKSLYSVWLFSTMAMHTAIAVVLTALGLLMSRPRRCVHSMLTGSGPGSHLMRRLIPVVVIVPLILGWGQLSGQWRGLYRPEFGTAMLVMMTILVLTGVIWWHAILLERLDRSRRQAEEDRDTLLSAEQVARKRAEQAVAAREQLLSIVSHELRTPLTPVLLIATSLENRKDLSPEVAADLRLIREQIQVEARIIDDLLDLVGMHQGKLRLRLQSLNLRHLIQETVNLFDRLYTVRQLGLEVNWQAGDCRIKGDGHRMQQVFRALLDNAMKFTPAGGSVTITCTGPSEGQITLDVADTGVGIPAEATERIFEPFEQVDGSMTRRHGGMGIGLTLCRQVVQLHGGTITAVSQGEGKGATLRLILPVDASYVPSSDPSPAEPTSSRDRSIPTTPLRMLIVEDNADTLRMLGRLMRSLGHIPTSVTCAREAMEALSRDVYDLMISDIGLPDESGWSLMHRVRQSYPIRAIAISGFVDESDQERSLAAGFVAHLPKPIAVQDLIRAIGEATGRGDAVQQQAGV